MASITSFTAITPVTLLLSGTLTLIQTILGSFLDYRDENTKCYIFQILLQLDMNMT